MMRYHRKLKRKPHMWHYLIYDRNSLNVSTFEETVLVMIFVLMLVNTSVYPRIVALASKVSTNNYISNGFYISLPRK
jgi:hypothetical protein